MAAMSTSLIVMIVVVSVMALIVVYLCISWYTWHKSQVVRTWIPRVRIDPHEYEGKWYEQARRPFAWEQGCKSATAEYTVAADGNAIRVINACDKNGLPTESKGWAYPTKRDGVLSVSFFPGIYGNYTVTYREKDVSIVTNSDGSLLWILTRQPEISRAKMRKLIDWLKVHGFTVKDLEFR